MTIKTLYEKNQIAIPVALAVAVLGHLYMYAKGASGLLYVPWVTCLIAMLFSYSKPRLVMVKSGLRSMACALIILSLYVACVLAFQS